MPITPPEFLLPLRNAIADVTTWFDWGALSGVGTVGALWFAVVQSSRSSRLERAHAIGTLTALNSLIEPICDAIPIFPGEGSRLLDTNELAFLIASREVVERAIAGLRLVTIPDVAAAGISEWYMALPIALEGLLKSMPKSLNDKIRLDEVSLLDSIRYIQEASADFREKRNFLEYGRLGGLFWRGCNHFHMWMYLRKLGLLKR